MLQPRARLVATACALLVLAMDPSIARAGSPLLAEVTISRQGGVATPLEALEFVAIHRPYQEAISVRPQHPLTAADIGHRVKLSGPEVGAFVAGLVNATDDLLGFQVGWSMASNNESFWFDGFPSPAPDLAGFVIDEIMVQVDGLVLDSPGQDPGGNGNWTDYVFEGRFQLYGMPAGGGVLPASPSLSFEVHTLGDVSPAQSLDVSNVGWRAFELGTPGIEGPDAGHFSVASSTCDERILAPGQSCTIRLDYAPGDGSQSQARLLIPSDADPSPAEVALAGTVVGVFRDGYED